MNLPSFVKTLKFLSSGSVIHVYIFIVYDSTENVGIALNLFDYRNDLIIIYETKYQSILHKVLAEKKLEPIDDRPAVTVPEKQIDDNQYINKIQIQFLYIN